MLLTRLKSNEFDRLRRHQVDIFDHLDRMFNDSHFTRSLTDGFPPHNIRKKNGSYLIEMAVAGFSKSEIQITKQKDYLTIEGEKEIKGEDTFLYQGIAGRSFKKTFALGNRVKVIGADLKDGMLFVALDEEVPEEEKPQNIEINSGSLDVSRMVS